ncbi:hypothetical protein FACS1894139_03920 [Planctomycetales bacterium]|nr:hypothetical protein FACS1894139_03920 [Planctomycetales bacterium]GHV19707.1 hypothetical protein AGMMS49959_05460 [Planctomycetales bacterium]
MKKYIELDTVGAVLWEEFIAPLNLSVENIGAATGILPARLREIIDGAAPVTAEIDLRLTKFLQLSAGYFLRLQANYETLRAKRKFAAQIMKIIPFSRAAALV